MREKTWTDEYGNSMTVRAGAVGYDIDLKDSDGRVFNLSLGYDVGLPMELSYMYASRDGKVPAVSADDMKFSATVARRIYLAHEVGHAVGLHPLADTVVGLFKMAQEDERYGMVLAAMMGAADDLTD
jgi:hypothetical protein